MTAMLKTLRGSGGKALSFASLCESYAAMRPFFRWQRPRHDLTFGKER